MVSDVVVEVLFIIGEYISYLQFSTSCPLDLSLSLHPINEILVWTVILLEGIIPGKWIYNLKKKVRF